MEYSVLFSDFSTVLNVSHTCIATPVLLVQARRSRIVVGDSSCLSSESKLWEAFVQDCQWNGNFYRVAPDHTLQDPNQELCPSLKDLLRNGYNTGPLVDLYQYL